MLVIESRFFFHGLFYEKFAFSSLASFGLIRRNFAMSRINWLGNKFFFSFVFSFSFFYKFHRSKSLILNLKFRFFLFLLFVFVLISFFFFSIFIKLNSSF